MEIARARKGLCVWPEKLHRMAYADVWSSIILAHGSKSIQALPTCALQERTKAADAEVARDVMRSTASMQRLHVEA